LQRLSASLLRTYDPASVRILIYLLIVGGLAVMPFVVMRQPWAMGFWGKLRLLFVIYALVILFAGVMGLVLRWDEIYG
jgi:hypothetical protein